MYSMSMLLNWFSKERWRGGEAGAPWTTFLSNSVEVCINDYAKDGGPGEVWLLCSFYHEPLRALIVKEVQ